MKFTILILLASFWLGAALALAALLVVRFVIAYIEDLIHTKN